MQEALKLHASGNAVTAERSSFAVDTTFVLFFLAVDFGNSARLGGIELALPLVTLAAFLVLPYYLPCQGDRPEFGRWLFGRLAVAAVGVMAGMALRQATGGALPEYFAYLPMTMLIVSAAVSSFLQFSNILGLRSAN